MEPTYRLPPRPQCCSVSSKQRRRLLEWIERKTQAKGPRSVRAKQIHWTSETTDHGGQPTENVEEQNWAAFRRPKKRWAASSTSGHESTTSTTFRRHADDRLRHRPIRKVLPELHEPDARGIAAAVTASFAHTAGRHDTGASIQRRGAASGRARLCHSRLCELLGLQSDTGAACEARAEGWS